jgi:hypothetical protein
MIKTGGWLGRQDQLFITWMNAERLFWGIPDGWQRRLFFVEVYEQLLKRGCGLARPSLGSRS